MVQPADGRDDGRAGRRGNGLSAPAYAVLTHCEPQIADGLLATLAAEGIAAYAVPHAGEVGGYLEVHPPARPVARVWVDAAAERRARELLAQRHPAPAVPPVEAEEAAWQQIVAALRRSGPDGPPPWPSAEDLANPGPPPVAAHQTEASPDPDRRGDPLAGPHAGAAPGGDPAEEWDADHFVPPPPPPVPRPSGAAAYGIAALVGGFAVLLVPTMAGDPVGPALLVLAIAAIVGGFATLVARMRAGPPTDSGPDDGAVV